MRIHGFQKMTMLDFPGCVACTVFTAGCNMRCPFCHNARLVTHIENEDEWSESEVLEYIEMRKGLLDGVCITGGEPTLQRDLPDFLRKIRALSLKIKLDTNGTNPAMLKTLIDEGLVDYVAMDIKNGEEAYGKTIGIDGFDMSGIKESIAILMENRIDYEFRTTVVNELHTEESLLAAAAMIAGAKKWFLQSFTDSGDIIEEGFSAKTKDFMKEIQQKATAFVEKVELRGI